MVTAILLFAFFACDKADNSTDFTKEGLFTAGIEGPAVDSDNHLFAVNFEKEG